MVITFKNSVLNSNLKKITLKYTNLKKKRKKEEEYNQK